ncbi:MAG: hypothetical protein ACK46A_09250 [Akkermansiaceae bacterium]|jgi:hypothetical protein|nr:hypothetical protein [Luteolibacter sp.]
MISDGQSIDLIHPGFNPPIPLRFTRCGTSATIQGGVSEFHQTGHGASYWNKFKEVIAHGYIPVEDAISLNLLPQGWKMPETHEWDALIATSKRIQ